MASGLAAAYFGAYFICPPTLSGYILRKCGYRITFISGKSLLLGVLCAFTKSSRLGNARCWLSLILALRSEEVLRRLLWLHVYRRLWPVSTLFLNPNATNLLTIHLLDQPSKQPPTPSSPSAVPQNTPKSASTSPKVSKAPALS